MTATVGVRYAGFWVRFVASVIDSILVTVIIVPLLWAAYGKVYFDTYFNLDPIAMMDRPMFAGLADPMISYVLPAVVVVLFWMARQATPGKMVVKIKIADATTLQAPTRGQDIGRYFGYFVSLFCFCLGFLWIAIDKRKQGWHDKLAGTVVIYQ
jgi:uncharacterized RDD family membrane protein YckC